MMGVGDCLPRVLAETEHLERVLDVGGSFGALNNATHVIDIIDYDKRKQPIIPQRSVRFSRETWTKWDICERPWPFPDKYFDYSFCAQTLEDIRDPVGVCREIMRVSRAGFIEVPSRLREIFHPKSGFWWRRAIGRPLRVGFAHHRWFCEVEGNAITFTAKTLAATSSRNFFLTSAELGRQLSSEESKAFLFWRGEFAVRERLLIEPGETEKDLGDFKRVCLQKLDYSNS